MATHSGILAWRIPQTEEPGGLQSRGHKESDKTERLHFHFLKYFQKTKEEEISTLLQSSYTLHEVLYHLNVD